VKEEDSMLTRSASFLGLALVSLAGFALGGEVIPNWSAPATWSPAKSRGGLTAMDVTNPLPFIGLAPCRIVDTRGNGAPIQGSLFTGGTRNYAVSGICGIPASAAALSLNFTVTGPGQTTPGFLLAWPFGGAVPPVSILNWDHVPAQIANAAVVPTGGPVEFTVNVSAPTHLIIDVNGYYSDGALGALASGERFTLVGDVFGGSTGLLVVHNTEGVAGARAGYFVADSSGFGSSGIGAIETASGGLTAGVYGQANSSTNKTAGLSGVAASTTGVVYGVYGQSNSPDNAGAAGVFGVDGTGDPGSGVLTRTAGVRGASTSGDGVVGVSRNIGVSGVLVDSGGFFLSAGFLGYLPTVGVEFANGLAGTGTKSFVEPHPTDASKIIRYVSLEGPEAGTYFRGRGRFQRGLATIEPPEDFRMVTDPESLSIQVTPIGDLATVAVLRIGLDGIVVRGSRDVEFFYLVNGVRRAYNHWDPIQENEKFFVPESPEARLPKYLSEEERGRLIANGTYNADGTVNMTTAERVGWTKAWRDREQQAKAAAAANAATHPEEFPEKN
jgi:hypothetical protein